MNLNRSGWVKDRFLTDDYWLAMILLIVAVGCLLQSVLEVGWVPEDQVVIPAALIGLFLGVLLANRPLRSLAAWILITLYGLLITTVTLGKLWPPWQLLIGSWTDIRQYWLQNGALLIDRLASWFKAVLNGGSSDETIVFAYLMGLTAWFLTAYVGWSAYRQRRPLLGLILMGLVIAINGYYGNGPIEWAALFVGVAVFVTAVLHFAMLEQGWQLASVDYSREIRYELIIYAAVIGAGLLALALFLPTFSVTKFAQAFLAQPAVSEIEASLERAFAGVEQPRGQAITPGQAGGSGVLPRSFLLGNPPQLSETVMMKAQANVVEGDQIPLGNGRHWRALSYEVYTGRGWALSEERREDFSANNLFSLPELAGQRLLEQQIDWLYDDRVIRYSMGEPLRFDQDVVVSWRGLSDLVRVRSTGNTQYSVLSRLTIVPPEALSATAVDAIPPTILARYTQLPQELPSRIQDLAQEIAADQVDPYGQAHAIERFLRQYPYSLDVSAPPADSDVVDYFLFDLQSGYCDYYGSAMVVMARSLGLPARLATGFLAQEADENGVQTILQINAHSWAEIYFAEYGWVEFEPTAAFVSPHDEQLALSALSMTEEPEFGQSESSPPIPERIPQRPFPWSRLLFVAALLGGVLFIWWQQRRSTHHEDAIQLNYRRLQQNARKLGQPTPPSQTPLEFSSAFQQRLARFGAYPRLTKMVAGLPTAVAQLTQLFVEQQYRPGQKAASETSARLWHRLQRPLWLLRLVKRFTKED